MLQDIDIIGKLNEKIYKARVVYHRPGKQAVSH
jgi:hypothetical protein